MILIWKVLFITGHKTRRRRHRIDYLIVKKSEIRNSYAGNEQDRVVLFNIYEIYYCRNANFSRR